MKGQIEWLPLETLIPYEKNARINDDAVPLVAASIKEFGFQNPIIADKNRVIICGHTRFRAAKSLGLREVPVLVASDLTEEKVRAFRLADNKVSEASKWDNALLFEELETLKEFDCDMAEFGFEEDELWRRRAGWSRTKKYCDLTRRIKTHLDSGMSFTTLYEVGRKGIPLDELKENPANVPLIADNVVDFIEQTFGANIKAGDWCLVTAPRRRHKTGLHFATAVCSAVSEELRLPFYEGAFVAEDRARIEPRFELVKKPREKNALFFDDVITTSQTARACRRLLIEHGYVVYVVAGIKNRTGL